MPSGLSDSSGAAISFHEIAAHRRPSRLPSGVAFGGGSSLAVGARCNRIPLPQSPAAVTRVAVCRRLFSPAPAASVAVGLVVGAGLGREGFVGALSRALKHVYALLEGAEDVVVVDVARRPQLGCRRHPGGCGARGRV